MSDSKQPSTPAGNQSIEGETEDTAYQASNSNPLPTLQEHDAEKTTQPKPPGNDAPDGDAEASWCLCLLDYVFSHADFADGRAWVPYRHFLAIGGLATNPINGAILESAGGCADLKIFSRVLCITGTNFMLAARIRKTGWELFARF